MDIHTGAVCATGVLLTYCITFLVVALTGLALANKSFSNIRDKLAHALTQAQSRASRAEHLALAAFRTLVRPIIKTESTLAGIRAALRGLLSHGPAE
jgi:hypothetical protein